MEAPHLFGEFENLVGIANLPPRVPRNTQQTVSCCGPIDNSIAVVMLSPGMIHHAGPYRLYVRLARELANVGIPSLRFDLSGIGESLAVGMHGASLDRAASETRQALDSMQTTFGFERFVLFGLCAGADDSLYAALGDQRVVGCSLLDGCGYRTKSYYWHRLWNHYLPRMRCAGWWHDVWKRRLANDSHDVPVSLQVGSDIREFPRRDVAEKWVRQLIEREVRLQFLYTGGVEGYYNHAGQFAEMFPSLHRVSYIETDFLPQSDHVAILEEDRAVIVEAIVDWVTRTFGQAKTSMVVDPFGRCAESGEGAAR